VNTWKVIFATMVIFGTGVVTGGLLVRYSSRPVPGTRVVARVAPTSPGGMRVEFLRRMERELELSPDQHDRVDRIIKESQERTRRILEPVSPQMREEMDRAKDRFRGVLTQQQQGRFDELVKQQQRPHEKARRDRPPEGGGLPTATGEIERKQ